MISCNLLNSLPKERKQRMNDLNASNDNANSNSEDKSQISIDVKIKE